MNLKSIGSIAFLIIGAVLPSSVSATIIEATYTGTATTVTDLTNIFNGATGGQTYTATFTFDTSLGADLHATYDPAYQGNVGGTNWTGSPSNPVLSASFTINGITQTITNPAYEDYFYAYLNPSATSSQIAHYAQAYFTQNGAAFSSNYISGDIYRLDGSLPLTLTGPATYSSELGNNFFILQNYDGQQYTLDTVIGGTVNTLTIGPVGVPGPTVGAGASSFALAALFLGWLVRRRGHQMV